MLTSIPNTRLALPAERTPIDPANTSNRDPQPSRGEPDPLDARKLDRTAVYASDIEKTTEEEALQLESLGLPIDVLQRAKANMAKIHEEASHVNASLVELSRKRMEHDAMMKVSLPINEYENYVKFEKGRIFRQELEEMIAPFLKAKNTPVGEDYNRILEAIQRVSATTLERSHGPYDGPPRPTTNPLEAMSFYQSEIRRIDDVSSQALTSLQGSVSQEVLDNLKNYYSQRINELLNSIENIVATKELSKEQLAEWHSQVREILHKRSEDFRK